MAVTRFGAFCSRPPLSVSERFVTVGNPVPEAAASFLGFPTNINPGLTVRGRTVPATDGSQDPSHMMSRWESPSYRSEWGDSCNWLRFHSVACTESVRSTGRGPLHHSTTTPSMLRWCGSLTAHNHQPLNGDVGYKDGELSNNTMKLY